MKNSITVQPLDGRKQGKKVEQQSKNIVRLIEHGSDSVAAQQLIERLANGTSPQDKFDAAAIDAFTDTIIALSNPSVRQKSVS